MTAPWNLSKKDEFMHDSHTTDSELVSSLKGGDEHAFEMIYRRYWKFLYRYAFRQLGVREEAEEVIHDLMTSLWQNRQQTIIQNLKIYLFISARNLINKSIRSQINLRRFREHQMIQGIIDHTDDDITWSDSDLHTAIEQVLQKLPTKTAQIFRMSKLELLPVKKIASKMELSDKAVEYHITKSIKMLRQHLYRFQSHN
ncbi:sigma-70 family RNA polymerase sigma factor [Dyadobacter tibetensis]|uniref:sigma-70 family RNA polymerase sigma factor n=1 Tax=Dyadobacter tibetensis TaxID=1211851 RepID=UPI0004AC84E6|nr:sigma-70 family RNA polymerase sigma factor [Dyadobacter tibetensis]